MKARQIVLLNVIGFVVVIALLVGGYIFFYNANNYISEDDAHVAVSTQSVIGLAAGTLTKWAVQDGSNVSADQVLGQELLPTGQTVDITSPIAGQVLKSSVVAGQVVAQGTLLASVANLDNEYILANVKETDIRHVQVGQTVDIYMTAYPGTSFTGTVRSVGNQSAAQTSVIPSSQSSGNFTKQVQRIPVTISLDGKEGKMILPNMNVTVRIHR